MIVITQLTTPPVASCVVPPRLFIENGAWAKILAFARISGNMEINGFGYVQADGVDYSIESADDIFITKQKVSGGAAEVEPDVFAMGVDQAQQDGRSDELRFQWHSHVNGSAEFSSIDTNNIESYGAAGMEYFISLVMNKRGELSARLDMFRPMRIGAAMAVILYDDSVSQIELRQEIAAKVNSTPVPIIRFAPTAKKPARRPRTAKPEPVTTSS